jgi:hypothetical protein
MLTITIFIIKYVFRSLSCRTKVDMLIQAIGIKSNFSQPFFVHWDALLGTRMTRDDIERRRQKQDLKSQ